MAEDAPADTVVQADQSWTRITKAADMFSERIGTLREQNARYVSGSAQLRNLVVCQQTAENYVKEVEDGLTKMDGGYYEAEEEINQLEGNQADVRRSCRRLEEQILELKSR